MAERHADRHEEMRLMLRSLKLPAIASQYQDLALKAAKANLTHEAFLYELVRAECIQREEHRVARLQRLSGLPPDKTFRTLQLDRFPPLIREQLDDHQVDDHQVVGFDDHQHDAPEVLDGPQRIDHTHHLHQPRYAFANRTGRGTLHVEHFVEAAYGIEHFTKRPGEPKARDESQELRSSVNRSCRFRMDLNPRRPLVGKVDLAN